MEFSLENPFTNFHELFNDDDEDSTETILESLFLVESDHMPSKSYIKTLKDRDLYNSLRSRAVSSILQVNLALMLALSLSILLFLWVLIYFIFNVLLQFSCKFDPFLSYLAVNYMDRYLSSQEMLVKIKIKISWTMINVYWVTYIVRSDSMYWILIMIISSQNHGSLGFLQSLAFP